MPGFFRGAGHGIMERNEEAREYYYRKLVYAFDLAHQFRVENRAKMEGALTVGRQLMAIGVPEDVVISIANQNPDDLQNTYDELQKLQLNGVKMDENAYRQLLQVHGEVQTEE